MIKKLLKILALLLAVVILAPAVFTVSWRLYYLHIVRQTPGKLAVPIQPGILGAQVNVFSGSGGWPWVCAHNGPAAMTPFGMLRVGPDTASILLDRVGLNFSGYYYGDNKLLGFSHTRFIGSGGPAGGSIRVLPTTASHADRLLAVPMQKRYVRFSHSQETGFPGYYAVYLPQDDVLAELTATPHCGVHRYTFKRKGEAHILLNPTSAIERNARWEGQLEVVSDKNEVNGVARVGGGSDVSGGLDLYFVARFNRPFTNTRTTGDKLVPHNVGVDLTFPCDTENSALELRLAISYVSAANARLNLEAEAANRPFDGIANAARDEWEKRLSVIQVTGGAEKQRRIFYTALFRCFQMPTRFADVNGEYIGFDRKVHKQEGFQYYTDFSLWDTFRTVHPLYTLIAPEDQRDMMISLIEMAKIDKSLPRWPAGCHDTGSMIGTPADIAVSEAYLKGIHDIDIETAYAAMRQTALHGPTPDVHGATRNGLEEYLQYRYLPADKMDKAVARTLEYTWSDYAISQLAEALGKKDDAAVFAEHAHYYRNVWNPATQYFQPRDSKGNFMPFDPLVLTYTDFRNKWAYAYLEGSGLQWRWGVPFDPDDLVSLFSSREYFLSELKAYFEKSRAPMGAWNPGPYYWHGNEPYFHAPYLFNHVGRPDLTQKWVRWILGTMYADDYVGLAGNDDMATLSAWYVFNALGFYPIAGTTRYELAAPLFDRAEVRMGAATLTVIAENQSPDNRYVKRITLNGAPLDRTCINHDEIDKGGTLQFEMAATPSPQH